MYRYYFQVDLILISGNLGHTIYIYISYTFLFSGQDLIVHEGAHLNGIPLSEMLSRIVTLNTPQQILSEKIFLNPVHLQKASTVGLNGKELSGFVGNVVLTDEVSNTTAHKSFTGQVYNINYILFKYEFVFSISIVCINLHSVAFNLAGTAWI